jgi:hypothetical protein
MENFVDQSWLLLIKKFIVAAAEYRNLLYLNGVCEVYIRVGNIWKSVAIFIFFR